MQPEATQQQQHLSPGRPAINKFEDFVIYDPKFKDIKPVDEANDHIKQYVEQQLAKYQFAIINSTPTSIATNNTANNDINAVIKKAFATLIPYINACTYQPISNNELNQQPYQLQVFDEPRYWIKLNFIFNVVNRYFENYNNTNVKSQYPWISGKVINVSNEDTLLFENFIIQAHNNNNENENKNENENNMSTNDVVIIQHENENSISQKAQNQTSLSNNQVISNANTDDIEICQKSNKLNKTKKGKKAKKSKHDKIRIKLVVKSQQEVENLNKNQNSAQHSKPVFDTNTKTWKVLPPKQQLTTIGTNARKLQTKSIIKTSISKALDPKNVVNRQLTTKLQALPTIPVLGAHLQQAKPKSSVNSQLNSNSSNTNSNTKLVATKNTDTEMTNSNENQTPILATNSNAGASAKSRLGDSINNLNIVNQNPLTTHIPTTMNVTASNHVSSSTTMRDAAFPDSVIDQVMDSLEREKKLKEQATESALRAAKYHETHCTKLVQLLRAKSTSNTQSNINNNPIHHHHNVASLPTQSQPKHRNSNNNGSQNRQQRQTMSRLQALGPTSNNGQIPRFIPMQVPMPQMQGVKTLQPNTSLTNSTYMVTYWDALGNNLQKAKRMEQDQFDIIERAETKLVQMALITPDQKTQCEIIRNSANAAASSNAKNIEKQKK